MASKENIQAAKELVDKYLSITLKELYSHSMVAPLSAYLLTGFGSKTACPLCISVDGYCHHCIYGPADSSCTKGKNKDTYYAIKDAANPEELFLAFRMRALHLKKIINKKDKS